MKPYFKTALSLLSLILPLFFHSCASKEPNKVSLDPTSQKFLDMVAHIVLPVEEKIFREMPLEDRGEFIRDFWARRDPDLSTPENEYRQTYYTSLAVADKAFRAGKPGWKTDRGRIYILLGPPTNVIKKAMGDSPYEQGKFVTANPLETGTLTERPTEIWVYDNYSEYFSGPLRLVFVDYHSTGDYELTTKLEITPFSMVSPEWDAPNLAKYQWIGQIEMGEKNRPDFGIFDYNASLEIKKTSIGPSALIKIDIPYARLDFRKTGEKYSCDLFIWVEITDNQKKLLTRQEEPLIQSFSEEQIKNLIQNSDGIHKEWELDLPPGSQYVFISAADNIRGKRLRKLLEIKN